MYINFVHPLIQVEREKLRSEEFASKSVLERESMDRNINRLDEENRELQKHLQSLQGNLAEAEQQHSQRYTVTCNVSINSIIQLHIIT